MEQKVYIVTGANGHLGNTIIRLLHKQHFQIRSLILPGTPIPPLPIAYVEGDVCRPDSLRPLFSGLEHFDIYVIHAAGIVDISEKISPEMYEVNVNGTKNMIALCLEYHVKRLLYVSSVHAIPEKSKFRVMCETDFFSPKLVNGAYAKTKAEATQAVLDALGHGLDAVIVHPSGIIGPYDTCGNHLVQLVERFSSGKLPACVRGGYDFVDVRDVADGCLKALDKGRTGHCYILSNRHYEIKDILTMAGGNSCNRKIPTLPIWLASISTPFITYFSNKAKQKPLYTKYSLRTLKSNDRFNHDKATSELDYRPRDIRETIKDTIKYDRLKRI